MNLTEHDIDVIKSLPRKELNAECLHLMREQMELTQELHGMKKRMAALEHVVEAAKTWIDNKDATLAPTNFSRLIIAINKLGAMDT